MLNRIYRSKYNLQFDHVSHTSNDDTITVAVSLYNYEKEILDCLESIKTRHTEIFHL